MTPSTQSSSNLPDVQVKDLVLCNGLQSETRKVKMPPANSMKPQEQEMLPYASITILQQTVEEPSTVHEAQDMMRNVHARSRPTRYLQLARLAVDLACLSAGRNEAEMARFRQ